MNWESYHDFMSNDSSVLGRLNDFSVEAIALSLHNLVIRRFVFSTSTGGSIPSLNEACSLRFAKLVFGTGAIDPLKPSRECQGRSM